MKDWLLIVAGDKKTPQDYKLKRGTYLSVEDQHNYDKPLSNAIGWNTCSRRTFAILCAYDMGADVIATVDDDNIPYDWWGKDLLLDKAVEVNFYLTDLVAFDPVGAVTNSRLWHRGFPLPLLTKRRYIFKTKTICRSVQADFWNGNPDVDAICRMEHAPTDCIFLENYFPLASSVFSPFNSQNTFLSRMVIPDYFIFPGMDRTNDIWASYYAESKGWLPVYGRASVFQKRNEHDLIKDMQGEYLGYEKNLNLIQDLQPTKYRANSEAIYKYLPEHSRELFRLYKRHFGS
jgi:hypothetical protein